MAVVQLAQATEYLRSNDVGSSLSERFPWLGTPAMVQQLLDVVASTLEGDGSEVELDRLVEYLRHDWSVGISLHEKLPWVGTPTMVYEVLGVMATQVEARFG